MLIFLHTRQLLNSSKRFFSPDPAVHFFFTIHAHTFFILRVDTQEARCHVFYARRQFFQHTLLVVCIFYRSNKTWFLLNIRLRQVSNNTLLPGRVLFLSGSIQFENRFKRIRMIATRLENYLTPNACRQTNHSTTMSVLILWPILLCLCTCHSLNKSAARIRKQRVKFAMRRKHQSRRNMCQI